MCPVALVLSLFYWSLVRSNFIRAHDAVIITFYRFSRGSSVGQCTRALPRIFLCRTGPINRRKYLHGDHHRWPHQRNCRIRFNGESTFTELCPLNKIQNHHKNHSVWKSQKSFIQHCERSKLRLHFEWTKVNILRKWSIWRFFEKLKLAVKQCYQTGKF